MKSLLSQYFDLLRYFTSLKLFARYYKHSKIVFKNIKEENLLLQVFADNWNFQSSRFHGEKQQRGVNLGN